MYFTHTVYFFISLWIKWYTVVLRMQGTPVVWTCTQTEVKTDVNNFPWSVIYITTAIHSLCTWIMAATDKRLADVSLSQPSRTFLPLDLFWPSLCNISTLCIVNSEVLKENVNCFQWLMQLSSSYQPGNRAVTFSKNHFRIDPPRQSIRCHILKSWCNLEFYTLAPVPSLDPEAPLPKQHQ